MLKLFSMTADAQGAKRFSSLLSFLNPLLWWTSRNSFLSKINVTLFASPLHLFFITVTDLRSNQLGEYSLTGAVMSVPVGSLLFGNPYISKNSFKSKDSLVPLRSCSDNFGNPVCLSNSYTHIAYTQPFLNTLAYHQEN